MIIEKKELLLLSELTTAGLGSGHNLWNEYAQDLIDKYYGKARYNRVLYYFFQSLLSVSYKDAYRVLEKFLKLPLKDMPPYINDAHEDGTKTWKSIFAWWRIKINK